ncbi:MAG: hypothetical protein IJ417_08635 [Bacteroidaceae bacterium]|nr:hypothetical protein [Bacteroidaceae bacterium]
MAYLLVCQSVVVEWVQGLHFRLLVESEKMPVAHLRLPCSRIFFVGQQICFRRAAELFLQGRGVKMGGEGGGLAFPFFPEPFACAKEPVGIEKKGR